MLWTCRSPRRRLSCVLGLPNRRSSCANVLIGSLSLQRAVTRWTGAVTHDGELSGIPPTGNRGMPPGMEIVRISGGKDVEGWEGYDTMNLMQQLGVV